MNKSFPLEEGLIPTLIEGIVNFLSGAVYKPKDAINDANDDLDSIARFLARNLKKNWERDDAK